MLGWKSPSAVPVPKGLARGSLGCHQPSKRGQISPGTRAQRRWPRRPSPARSSLLSPPDPPAFDDQDHDLVLTREDIKKQGLLLIESNKKHGKK